MLKDNKVKKLTSLSNLWFYLGSVPSRTCEGRTTLIAKTPGTTDPESVQTDHGVLSSCDSFIVSWERG